MDDDGSGDTNRIDVGVVGVGSAMLGLAHVRLTGWLVQMAMETLVALTSTQSKAASVELEHVRIWLTVSSSRVAMINLVALTST